MNKKLNKILKIDDISKEYKLNPKYIHHGKHTYSGRYTDNLIRLFGKLPRKENQKITNWHKDLAFEIQDKLEKVVTNLFINYSNLTGIKNFTIGGGVGLNVKMNSKLFNSKNCNNIFPNPLCADNGASAGSAMLADFILNKNKPKKLTSLALGLDYSESEIIKTLKSNKVKFLKVRNIEKYAAKKLSEGKVIGWFQGRMEAAQEH